MDYSRPASYWSGQYMTRSGDTSASFDNRTWKILPGTKSIVNNPDWQLKISKRVDASSAYNLQLADITPGTFHYNLTWQNTSAPKNFVEVGGASFVPSLTNLNVWSDPFNSVAVARRKLSNRVRASRNDFKALVPLGELKETRGLIKSMVPKTASLIKDLYDLKKNLSHPSRLKEQIQRASDYWLTYSFGIKPTVSDINGLLSAINESMENRNPSKHFSVVVRNHWSDKATKVAVFNVGNCTAWCTYSFDRELEVFYQALVEYQIIGSNNYNLSSHFGLNFGEIVSAGWELVPYSWIVDYFTTTGEFLSETFSSTGTRVIYCNLSKICKTRLNGSCNYDKNSSAAIKSFSGSASNPIITGVTFNRSVETAIPAPSLRLKTVDEIGVNAVNRLLNLSALLLKK